MAEVSELVRAFMSATAAQQESTRKMQELHSASLQVQQETNRLLQEQINGARAEREAMLRQLAQARVGSGHSVAIKSSQVLQKMTESDDVEAFLLAFERTATREEWPKEKWAGVLAPFLVGDAQKAYYDLSPVQADSYDHLKAEILARAGVTMAVRAQKYHAWTYSTTRAPRSQLFDLLHLTNRWLQPEVNSSKQMMEVLVMDRYLRALPGTLRKWVGQGDPKDLDQFITLVERQLAAEDLARQPQTGTYRKPTNQWTVRKVQPDNDPGKNLISLSEPEERFSTVKGLVRVNDLGEGARKGSPRDFSQYQCFRCHKIGHIAKRCPQLDEPMQCNSAEMFCGSIIVSGTPEGQYPYLITVWVNGIKAQALIDSGSALTLVAPEYVNTTRLESDLKTGITCIHGDVKYYPTSQVKISCEDGEHEIRVGVIPRLPHQVILGRDYPGFNNLTKLKGKLEGPMVNLERGKESPESLFNLFPFSDSDVFRGGERTSYKSRRQQRQEKKKGPPQPTVLVGQVAKRGQKGVSTQCTTEGIIEETGEVELEVDPERGSETWCESFSPNSEHFGREQENDPTLVNIKERVVAVNGVPIENVTVNPLENFVIKNDLVYRNTILNGSPVEQLLVPKMFRNTVLQLAHNHLFGAHLGGEKTLQRVLQRFYWLGIRKDVERFCKSCPRCQKASPRPHLRAPLEVMPIIDVPFERIAMDLVGPLNKSARGHEYILVILDYATRYPEAIPLRNMASKTIAKELVHVFTRVGIPKEILTDQGAPFVSKLMKDLCGLLRIKPIRTSVYHPQTDGLVERFNQTLKAMLRKVISQDGKEWDLLLPYLMFAVREVPQSSTGFSPFELLYGRQPRGILDIAKESWEEQKVPGKNIVEHVLQMKDRIEKVTPIVQAHLKMAQARQAEHYNRTAKRRTFNPGDRVMVLVPVPESKLFTHWQGPYEVIEAVGPVNYKISQPDRRKTEQIYHINLLKPWVEREVLMSKVVTPQNGKINIGPSLTQEQKDEVQELVKQNLDVFSSLPGRTKMIQHAITTPEGIRVKVRPYRVPEAKREDMHKEIENMIKLGVIEESSSPWSSPIVMVAKPNGTWRFCNDFRQLNKVSKFDAYPMPRVDELIERLGKAKYLTTLDLTKGYWQIPLSPESKEKTAFSTPRALYQYKMMPFGLHGAPATFQRLMDKVLRPHAEYASAYIDDIVIFSEDWDSHVAKLKAVLQSLREASLTANPEKCFIGLTEAKYLGYIVGGGAIKPQVDKVEAIRDWPIPQTKKQVRAFLGLAGYYRRFVPEFSSVATPLTELIRKTAPNKIKWTESTEEAFVKLKDILCSGPVLGVADFTKPFIVQTDASEVGVGAVLSQIIDDEEHPIMYLSRKLLPREQNYAVVEKECLAVRWAIESLKYYLLGREFTLVTDHSPLKWMKENREKNARVTRWFLALQPYRFKIEHRSGVKNANADGLSRVHEKGKEVSLKPVGFSWGKGCVINVQE